MSSRHRTVRLSLLCLAALASLSCATVTRLSEDAVQRLAPAAAPRLGSLEETEAAIQEAVPNLEADAAEAYTDAELNAVGATLTYTVRLSGNDEQRLWGYGWCATTEAILTDNLQKMDFEFRLNGEIVPLEKFLVLQGSSGDELACAYLAAVVTDWPAGTSTLETVVTFTTAVNDGMADFEAGSTRFIFTVTAP